MSNLIEKQAAIEAVGLNTWAGSRISQLPTVEAIPIKWLCDYAVIITENNYEQAKFIFRLIENYKSELNEDKDKAATDNLKRMKENWLNTKRAEEENV